MLRDDGGSGLPNIMIRLRRFVAFVLGLGQLTLPLAAYATPRDPAAGVPGFGALCSARAEPARGPAAQTVSADLRAVPLQAPIGLPVPAPLHDHAHCPACAPGVPPALTGHPVVHVFAAVPLFGTPATSSPGYGSAVPAHADARAPPRVF